MLILVVVKSPFCMFIYKSQRTHTLSLSFSFFFLSLSSSLYAFSLCILALISRAGDNPCVQTRRRRSVDLLPTGKRQCESLFRLRLNLSVCALTVLRSTALHCNVLYFDFSVFDCTVNLYISLSICLSLFLVLMLLLCCSDGSGFVWMLS